MAKDITDNSLIGDMQAPSAGLLASAVVMPELSYKDFPQPDTDILLGTYSVIYFNGTDYCLAIFSAEMYFETWNGRIYFSRDSACSFSLYKFDVENSEWNLNNSGYSRSFSLGFGPSYIDYYVLYSNYDIKDFTDKETVLYSQTVVGSDEPGSETGDTYNITVQLDEEPFLTKDFNDYTTTEGFLLIITVLLLFIFFMKIFNLDKFKGV